MKEEVFVSSYAEKEFDVLLKVRFQYHRMCYYLLLAYEYESFQIFIDTEKLKIKRLNLILKQSGASLIRS
ncbi:hypothetical protein Q0N10_14535, partial [Staphylococcus aureus]|nr:hypothetical protein [Staphylococcus aureus]